MLSFYKTITMRTTKHNKENEDKWLKDAIVPTHDKDRTPGCDHPLRHISS
jgi:hypothetical protein